MDTCFDFETLERGLGVDHIEVHDVIRAADGCFHLFCFSYDRPDAEFFEAALIPRDQYRYAVE